MVRSRRLLLRRYRLGARRPHLKALPRHCYRHVLARMLLGSCRASGAEATTR